jgi:phosphoglycolate phosphatase
MRRPAAVLFDLDGTLIDSAPDLAGTANDMREQRGQAPVPYDVLRTRAGSGARGMLAVAFGIGPGHDGYEALRDEFHLRYERRMLRTTAVFETVAPVLATLDAFGLPWGVVTNKALRFAEPMSRALGLLPRAAVLIGGDSTPHTKPHPAPLLEAARRLALDPRDCVYVGDDPRDVVAARAAGMAAWAAAWGYLGPEGDPQRWGADLVLDLPGQLLQSLDMA